jgi:hypothetical protein
MIQIVRIFKGYILVREFFSLDVSKKQLVSSVFQVEVDKKLVPKNGWRLMVWLMGISPIRLSPIGHSPMAKVHGYIGETTMDFRQLAKFQGVCWRNYSGLSPAVTKQY